ncbi:FAD-binding oxidoreductase [Roseomonas gilardii]|uniref:FAD-binding oxidoreductase n=1 Tax=Roseomonas gilardii TaxID=257708 RepID=UPI0004BBE3B5|nr:FAD-binding oxidoreductase [Roseomonas gilardii]
MTHAALPNFLNALGDIPFSTDAALLRQKSRDMSGAFSPVLKREAKDRQADAILHPRDQKDVLRIAAAAARTRMPLIARGGGSANFGQGIPLHGGAVVDLTALNKVLWTRNHAVRAECGARLVDIDAATRPSGWELRMHPSTKRVGTIGGYIGGGHAGVGSCSYGILRDRGNILGLQMVSVEEEPRIVELRGDDVNLPHHAYGANGLILEVEMPLAPAWPWVDVTVCFPDFMQATRFAYALTVSDGIVKKLVSLHQWPIPRMMVALAPVTREGEHMVLAMVAGPFMESFEALVAEHGGVLTSAAPEGQAPYGAPAYEFAWGHTRLQINKLDRSQVSCVGLYRDPDLVRMIGRSLERFRDVGPLHFEAKRVDGVICFQGAPVFPYVDDAQLAAVTEGMQEDGAIAANNHTFLVRENGMKPVDEIEIAFKRSMDPYDLLNPGKLAIDDVSVSASAGARFGAKGWWKDRHIATAPSLAAE